MGKKIIENFNLNYESVSNLDTNDATSTRIDKSRYEDNVKTEGTYNINAGKESKTKFKDSFKLKSDKILGLEMPSIKELSEIPQKEGMETPLPNRIPQKEGMNVENNSQIFGRLAMDAKEIEKNYKQAINYKSQSPDILPYDNSNKLENEGKDKVDANQTPIKEGMDVPDINQTPIKEGMDVSEPNQIPEKQATNDLSSYEPTEFDEVDNLSPKNNNDKINPFDNVGKLENLTSEFNDISEPVDFLGNDNAPGFVKDFDGPTKYVEDSSELDNLSDSHTFTPDNKYLDFIDGLENGNFPNTRDDLINNATNPYSATDTHTNIGGIGTDIPQEVDFLNNSIGGWTHIGRPDINHHMNIGQDLGILSQTQFDVDGVFSIDGQPVKYLQDDGSIAPNATNAFPLENFESENYDPRTEIPIGSQISNINDYSGTKSIIQAFQLSPFSTDIGISNYASDGPSPELVEGISAGDLVFDTSPPSKLYDLVAYDPRRTRTDAFGNETIISQNSYNGSIFDDGFGGLDGGGLFNSSINKYTSNSGYREQPSHTPKDIAERGNWGDGSVFDTSTAGLGYGVVSQSISKYEDTSGATSFISGSTFTGGSYLQRSFHLLTGEGLGLANGITLDAGSWYYGAEVRPGLPMTNDFQDPFEIGGQYSSYTHTDNQRSNRIITLPGESDGIPTYDNLTGSIIGGGDLSAYTLFKTESDKISHISGSKIDSRLSSHYGSSESDKRGLEPYYNFNIGDDTLIGDRDNLHKNRIKKFLNSPAGTTFRQTQQTLFEQSGIGGQGGSVASWGNITASGSDSFDWNEGHNTVTDGALNTGYTKYYSTKKKPFGSMVGTQNVPLDGLYIPDYMGDTNWAEKAILQGTRLALAGIDRAVKAKTSHQGTKGKPRGDFSTLLPMNNGKTLLPAYPTAFRQIESEENFYPFYFRDLRDRSYVFFRAYLSGLQESLTANWNEETPLGRSEGVYTYAKSTKNVGFTMDLYANTRDELDMIYEKLNKLQSMLYPEYKPDYSMSSAGSNKFGSMLLGGNTTTNTKLRAKPPLVKLRIGELFGRQGNEVLGFIESLNVQYPDTATWETSKGSRVPKHIKATIQYKVIHQEVPNMNTQFYGKQTGRQMMVNIVRGLVSTGGGAFSDWANSKGMGGFGKGGGATADSTVNALGTANEIVEIGEGILNEFKESRVPVKGEEV